MRVEQLSIFIRIMRVEQLSIFISKWWMDISVKDKFFCF